MWKRGDGWRAEEVSRAGFGQRAVPLQDTRAPIECSTTLVNRLGLMGATCPGRSATDARIDSERLEPFYAHCEKLGLPVFLHRPT